MQVIKVAVAGASGYAGGEILRLLLEHPEIEIGALTASSSVGKPLGDFHSSLFPLTDRVLEPTDPKHLKGHEVVFFALPHGMSRKVAEDLAEIDTEALLIDCGADHRLTDPAAWKQFYSGEYTEAWPYGLPELLHRGEFRAQLQREKLSAAQQIAVPGCNVTAVTLALQPGVSAGLVDSSDITTVLTVGYSGAGKALKPHLMATSALGNAVPYAVGGTHRHIPEIVQNFLVSGAAQVQLSFTPILIPMSRGILATVTAPLSGDAKAVRPVWEAAYQAEDCVRLLPEGSWPTTAPTVGTGMATVQVAVDQGAGKVIAMCALDNLGKGTASAAIQAMNLALKFPETTGIPLRGVGL